MTRQGWCLVVLAVMAGAGCWQAGRAGAPQLSQQVALAWTWTAFSVVAVGGVTAVIGSDL